MVRLARKIRFSFTLFPLAVFGAIATIKHIQPTIFPWAVGGGNLFQSALKTVIDTGNFILGTEVSVNRKIIDNFYAVWWRW